MNPAPSEAEIYIFSLAASDGKEGYVRAFLEKYPGSANLKNQFGGTALTYAAGRGQLETVELLLERGAALDLPDKNGDTPLMRAATKGHSEVVLRLLAKGASPDKTSHEGETALTLAKKFGHPDVERILGQYAEQRASALWKLRRDKLKDSRPAHPPFKKGPKPQ